MKTPLIGLIAMKFYGNQPVVASDSVFFSCPETLVKAIIACLTLVEDEPGSPRCS